MHLSVDDLDELLALLMQVKLLRACGSTSATRRISDTFKADSARYRVLRELEEGSAGYRSDSRRWPTIIDYFVETADKALTP